MKSPTTTQSLAALAAGAGMLSLSGPARAQEITPVWLQQINGLVNVTAANKLPILLTPTDTVIAQPGGTYREGREPLQNFARLIPFNAQKVLLAVMENGIDEVTADAAHLAIAAQYPDRSLVWLDAATSAPISLAWKESMSPADAIPYDVTGPHTGYQLSKVYQLWRPALDENPDPTKRAIYSGYKHLILRYAPKADGTGWETTPTIAWEEPVPGRNDDGTTITAEDGIGDGLSGTGAADGEASSWRSFRWRNIRVTGSGNNTVIYAGGGTWRIASHPQVFTTANGLNFTPIARVNDRDEGRRNAFALGGTSSRIVTPGTDANRPNLQVVYHNHYPGTGWEARPNRYTSNPGKPSPSPAYNQQPGVRMFQGDEGAAGGLPAFVWEAAGKDGLPIDHSIDGVDRYDGNWNISLDANNALDYLVCVSSSSLDVGFQTYGWLAIHRLDGSIASGNSSYKLPFMESDVTVDYGQSEPDFSATEAWVEVVPDLTAPGNLDRSTAYVSLENGGFGIFTIQNTPAALVSSPTNQTAVAGEDATLSANVTGSPNDFQWYHNGRPVPKAPYFQGAKKSTLVIRGATPADAGIYQLRWTNPISGAGQTATATLTVTGNYVRWADPVEIPSRNAETLTLEGTLEEAAASFTLSAGGLGAFDSVNADTKLSTGDTQYYRYETLTGDFDKKVRLMNLTTVPPATATTDKYARAGLIVRQSLNPADATLEIAASNPVINEEDSAANGNNFVRVAGRGIFGQIYGRSLSRAYSGVANNLPNQWLRMRRVGNSFTFHVSTNGTAWSQVGEQYQVFPETILFGTFAAPDNADGSSLAVAQFADYGDVIATDTVPPELLSVGTIDKKIIGVKFSEPVDSLSAAPFGNYTLSEGTVTGVRTGIGGNTVYLNVAGLTADTFTVSVSGVVDLAGNAVAPGSTASGRRSDWTATDIGYIQDPANRPTLGDDPYPVGQSVAVSSDANPEVEIIGGGSNAWNAGDYIHYLYREYTGNFDFAVAVDRYDKRGYAGGYANAGIRVRPSLYRTDNTDIGETTKVATYVNVTYYESSDPNRASIELNRVDPGAGYGNSTPYANNFQVGELFGYFPALRAVDASGAIDPQSDPAEAKWLRVKREGQTFSSLFSYDGVNWQEQDGSTREMPNLPASVLVGFGTMNDGGASAPPNSTYNGSGTVDENGIFQQNASNYGVLRIRSFGSYTPQAPSLGIRQNGAWYILSWPGTGYILEQSANLSTWTDSTLPVDTLSGVNSVSISATAPKMFFRLKTKQAG
ncbi:MAG: hypothetical protein EOP86_02350 [Verrucomicrobiaceae bacterium]|nr:MAG: hypothetical protein EOP86_02350 [Verrucomicrobiaceae bacterium]